MSRHLLRLARAGHALLLAVCLGVLARQTAAADSFPKPLENVRRVVFLGDSITYAGGYVETVDAYFATRFPMRPIEFLNLGLPSETACGLSEDGHADGKFPRPDLHERLDRVLAKAKPDLIFACYGMNDGIYLPLSEERFKKFQDGIQRLHDKVIASGVKIIHLTPPVFDEVKGGHPGYGAVLDRYSEWLVAQRKAGWEVVDLHEPMKQMLADRRKNYPNFFLAGDGVHCGEEGHYLIAIKILNFFETRIPYRAQDVTSLLADTPHPEEVLKLVKQRQHLLRDAWLTEVGHQRPGLSKGLSLPEAQAKAAEIQKQIRELVPPFPGKKSQWEGFDRYDYSFNGQPAIIVAPKQALPGNPWAWRGEFFGAFANADAALVAKGFHLVYLGVPNQFGGPNAIAAWDKFYAELTQRFGFAKKMALIGLSRGGLYCFNWAAANPEKVACIYADAAVCDFKSWPGGKLKNLGKGDGSAEEWKNLLNAYYFEADADAIAYRWNPVDNLKPLADAHIPLLHVYGDADSVVPWDENTGVIAERYRKLGGSIELISKPGVGHHPHGLSDPTPIVDFILKHAAPKP